MKYSLSKKRRGELQHHSFGYRHKKTILLLSNKPRDAGRMEPAPKYPGPLHLQGHLSECAEKLGAAIRSSVSHPVTLVRALHCACKPEDIQRALEAEKNDPKKNKSSSVFLSRAQMQRLKDAQQKSKDSDRLVDPDRRVQCRLFSLEVNDEDAVVVSFCKRCNKKFIVYDQALYWGTRRESGSPRTTYPYRCGCGGHTFEVGVGFEYYDEALDENDIAFLTIGVRCAACDEISVVLDDEAS